MLKEKSFEWIKIFVLISTSILLIFYQFNHIPQNISYDEVEFAQLALFLENKSYTSYSPIAFGHSTLYFYIILLSFKIFGINNFALRLPSALFGILGVLVFYLIMKKIFKKNAIHLLLSIIFLTSRWYLNFSRFSFEATFLLFLELISLYFLISQSPFFSGLFAGLAFNSYTPGRIFFLLPLGLIFIKYLKPSDNKITKPLLFFITPFIFTILPLTFYLLKNPDLRISNQLFLKNEKLSTGKKIDYFFKNIKSTALMFNIKGDMNGRHNFPGKPALNLILGGLFIIGFILTMRQWNNINNKLFIFYFFIALIPTLFTNPQENPNMLRTFTAIPATVYFIGVSLMSLITIFKKLLNKKLIVYLSYSILLTITLSSIYELYTYFNYQSRVFRNAFEIKCPIEKVIKTTRTTIPKSCLVSKNEF